MSNLVDTIIKKAFYIGYSLKKKKKIFSGGIFKCSVWNPKAQLFLCIILIDTPKIMYYSKNPRGIPISYLTDIKSI